MDHAILDYGEFGEPTTATAQAMETNGSTVVVLAPLTGRTSATPEDRLDGNPIATSHPSDVSADIHDCSREFMSHDYWKRFAG
jgi:hypothetical protein